MNNFMNHFIEQHACLGCHVLEKEVATGAKSGGQETIMTRVAWAPGASHFLPCPYLTAPRLQWAYTF